MSNYYPKMKSKLTFLLIFTGFMAYCQEQVLTGRVVADSIGLPGVFVINKAAGIEQKTDADGLFSITVKPGQKLVVYNDAITVREFHISADSFKNMPYVLAVERRSEEIEEVVINSSITRESLGLVPKGQKQYTPAQKRVLSYQGNTQGLSGFINLLRGRKFLEKIKTIYAKKEVDLYTLRGMYTEEQIVRDFNIPAQYAAAFLFYAVDDERMAETLKSGELGAARLLLAELSLKYLETIKEDE
jgi:hypothetical protein